MRKVFLALLLLLAVVSTAQTQVTSYVSTPAAAPAGSTLSTGLIAFWKLDETSGNRADSKGSNTLTANGIGGVGYGTGINGNAADFESSEADYLSINDNADLSFGDENFTISAWVKFETDPLAEICTIVSKYAASYSRREYSITTNNVICFYISNNGTAIINVQSSTDPIPDTWYNVVAWHNATTDSIYICINGGTVQRQTHTTGSNDNTSIFMIGYQEGGTVYLDGLVDDVGVWGRSGNAITGKAMADSIYNSGNGWRP